MGISAVKNLIMSFYKNYINSKKNVEKNEKALLAKCFFGGRRWIRTIEVDGRQIYSLLPLATRESFLVELANGIEPSTC